MRCYMDINFDRLATIESRVLQAAGRFSTREGRWPNMAYVSIAEASNEFLVRAAWGQVFCRPVPWLTIGSILVILEGENSHG